MLFRSGRGGGEESGRDLVSETKGGKGPSKDGNVGPSRNSNDDLVPSKFFFLFVNYTAICVLVWSLMVCRKYETVAIFICAVW